MFKEYLTEGLNKYMLLKDLRSLNMYVSSTGMPRRAFDSHNCSRFQYMFHSSIRQNDVPLYTNKTLTSL